VAYAPGAEPALFLGRGYTGHEHLQQFGLINMNARLYDPALGRFLSPDPYIQSPDFTQNYNRYSYCLNNPFKYTDTSGESVLSFLKEMGKLVVIVVAATVTVAVTTFVGLAVGCGVGFLVGGPVGLEVGGMLGLVSGFAVGGRMIPHIIDFVRKW